MAARVALFCATLAIGGCAWFAEPVPAPRADVPAVSAVAETQPVASADDAADDPAIWADPADPTASLIVGTDKQRGIVLYDLRGRALHRLDAGRINNVDLREGFLLQGKTVVLAAGSNRSDGSLDLWVLDPKGRTLREVSDGVLPLGMPDPYGLCMYRSARDGSVQIIVNDKDGRVQQWRTIERAAGKVGIEKLREFRLDSQPEGCVADDALGLLYLGEEARGVWRLPAEASEQVAPVLVDHTGVGGHLVADVEGMSLWVAAGDAGFLVVSSQGEHAYAVYDRAIPNRYRGTFAIVDDAAAGIDGAQETDGLDISSIAARAASDRGILVVQDGFNTRPDAHQNFKIVPFARVIDVLGLEPSDK